MMHGASGGYMLRVRAADTGEERWTSAPWNPPTLAVDSKGERDEVEIPDVISAELNGRAHVVAFAHGMRGRDALHEGIEVVRLAVYPAGASGASVKPTREVDVPVSARAGELRVHAAGGKVLVAWGERGPYPQSAASMDLATGDVVPYDWPDKLLAQCEEAPMCTGSRVMTTTVDGPLVAMGGGGFGVPGRWFSDDVRPAGVEAKSGFLGEWSGSITGVAEGQVIAGWETDDDNGAGGVPLWTVHDARTGKRLAGPLSCEYDDLETRKADRDYRMVASPGGRFLAVGPVAFDTKRKTGICLEGDGNRKTIVLTTLRDDGMAYGSVLPGSSSEAGDGVIAQVDLTTPSGEARVLGLGVEEPRYVDVAGAGVFFNRSEGQGVRVSARWER